MAYTRLPGKKKGFFRKNTLWLGEDHILAVESNHYTENYKRFYFKDLQAFVIRRTNRFTTIIGITTIAMLFFLFILMLGISRHYRGLIIFDGVVLLSLAVILAVHLKRGPTCACHLKMPLAVHELPPLCRLKYVRRVLEKITPMVQKFQGTISVDEIKSRIYENASRSPHPHPTQTDFTPPSRQLKEYSGFVHMIMFGFLLLDGAVSLLWVYSDHPVVNPLNLMIGSVSFILVIAALAKQWGTSLPGMVKGMVVTVLAVECCCCFCIYISIVRQIVQAAKNGRSIAQISQQGMILNMKPANDPLLHGAILCYVIVAAVIGIWGLAAIMIHRSKAGKTAAVFAHNASPAAGGNTES